MKKERRIGMKEKDGKEKELEWKKRIKKKEMRMNDLKRENWEQFELNRILVLLSVCECTLGFFQSSRQEKWQRGRKELTNKGKEFEKRGKRDSEWDEYKWKKGKEERSERKTKESEGKEDSRQDEQNRNPGSQENEDRLKRNTRKGRKKERVIVDEKTVLYSLFSFFFYLFFHLPLIFFAAHLSSVFFLYFMHI